jgi:trans-aconitate methyltransferase
MHATTTTERHPWKTTFRAPPKRTAWFTDMALAYVPHDRPARVLDLGCGTGDLLAVLARELPHATLTGLDISAANIEAANRLHRDPLIAGRLEFVCADYFDYRPAAGFDLIVSDSTLHLLPGTSDRLFAKLGSELAPGGHLVASLPYRCAYNSALASVRRALRAVRGRWTDRLILSVAKALHARQMPAELLRERVHYMYVVPQRWLSAAMVAQLAWRHCLHCVADRPYPHSSPAQPKHRLAIFCRPATANEHGFLSGGSKN